MTVSLEFRLPGYAATGERICAWKPVSVNLALAGYGGAIRLARPPRLAEERETPAMLWWPQEIVIDEVIEAPKGFEPRPTVTQWQAGSAEGFAHCDINATVKGRKVTHAGSFRYERRQVPVADWPEFRAAVHELKDAGDARLVAHREGK